MGGAMNLDELFCDADVKGGTCNAPATSHQFCEWCDTIASACDIVAHMEISTAGLVGHWMLEHPREVPEMVEALAADPRRRAILFDREKVKPAEYARLAAAVRAVGWGAAVRVPHGETIH